MFHHVFYIGQRFSLTALAQKAEVEVGDCRFIYFKILTSLCNIKNQWKIRDDLINLKFAKEKKIPGSGVGVHRLLRKNMKSYWRLECFPNC